ncbi:MAG TPA: DUF4160 domain-containing protein, partial [Dehalococcoidia bacterium]|nr:DUF4160 domain-containing protein [Dehalococcoidia bacterium]
NDHEPPHFHAIYAQQDALVNFETMQFIRGRLPAGPARRVLEWAALHRDELGENWTLRSQMRALKQIEPLD